MATADSTGPRVWYAGRTFDLDVPPVTAAKVSSATRVSESAWQGEVKRPRTLGGVLQLLGRWARRGGLSIFRGQPRYSDLRASIARSGRDPSDLPRLEAALVDDFRLMSRPFLASHEVEQADTVMGAMALLQHHGGATGLLDWTESVWVAAYFACIGDPAAVGYIWCFEHLDWDLLGATSEVTARPLFRERDIGEWKRACRTDGEWFVTFRPQTANGRMQAQQAMFTLANPMHVPHCEMIAALAPDTPRSLVAVPPSLKAPLLRYLSTMNVNAASLFPGLDGVCRNLAASAKFGLR